MRINTNIIALTACNSLSTASKRTSQSIEKLSSGYKINSVRDNPVGSALSAKMKSQLKNLEKRRKVPQMAYQLLKRQRVCWQRHSPWYRE